MPATPSDTLTSAGDLQAIADAVLRRAKNHGFIVARDVRGELTLAGQPGSQWKRVLALIAASLNYRHGQYHYVAPVSDRMRQEQHNQHAIQHVIGDLIEEHKRAASQSERRRQDRIDYVQPINVQIGEQRELTVLSRDLSTSGIRLIGTRSLLGQKVCVTLPRPGDDEPCRILVRILWTCTIGDGLFENGGAFVEIANEHG